MSNVSEAVASSHSNCQKNCRRRQQHFIWRPAQRNARK